MPKGGPPRKRQIRRKVTDSGRADLSPVDYLTRQLDELVADGKSAAKDRSWQALAVIRRQEREVWKELQAAREKHKDVDPDEQLTEDQALHQIVLPALRQMGRPCIEDVYRACLELLGLYDEEASAASVN